MGAGFAVDLEEDSQQDGTLAFYKQKAAERNKKLIQRINSHINEIAIDYEN